MRMLDSRVEPMHATLDLCARRAQLKPHSALADALSKLRDAPDANILKRMLESCIQVGQEILHAPFILHVARDTLCDLDGRRLGEISRRGGVLVYVSDGLRFARRNRILTRLLRRPVRAYNRPTTTARLTLLHRLDRTHTAIRLDALTLVIKVLAWCLRRAC